MRMVIDPTELRNIYASGLSMPEIAQHLQMSVHKVAYWMDKYGIPRRSQSEATYLKRNPNGDPFKISVIKSLEDTELLALGIALFMGEGDKKSIYSVRFANSNTKIIKLFIKFLKKICGVYDHKIKAAINIFDDNIYKESLDYWSKQTNIPKSNFYSPVIRPRKPGTYKNRSEFGTLTILVSNTKLLLQIKSWCEDYYRKYST